jgi:monoamine oxidase
MKKYDISIIGGGIGGLYSAYRLKKAYPEKSIALFESLPILGGRIQTGSFADGFFQPAYGALRIEPDFQTETDRFIRELNIQVKPIEQGEATSHSVPNLEKLSSQERQMILDNPDKGADLLLLELGMQKILGEQWDLEKDNLDMPNRNALLDELKKNAVYKGKPLYQQGSWNVFNDVLSYEAVEFFREKGPYYNMKNDNQNAIDWIVFLLNFRQMQRSSYIPVDGMIQFIHTIEKAVLDLGVSIYREHHLKEIIEGRDGLLTLTIEANGDNLELNSEHLVLAIPQYSLKKLSQCLPTRINTLLDSVMPIPILWATATLKNPPWCKDAPATSGENAPFRAGHLEYKERDGEPYGLAMLYCDGPWHQYWRGFVEDSVEDFHGYQYLPQVNTNLHLKEEIEKAIQQHFSLADAPHVEEWGIRDWGRPPFGAGVHFWKSGAESLSIMDELKAFALSEQSKNKNVHICGEAYSGFQGFFEGAIRTANYAIDAIQCAYTSHSSRAVEVA